MIRSLQVDWRSCAARADRLAVLGLALGQRADHHRPFVLTPTSPAR
jgi:hypothetical protein